MQVGYRPGVVTVGPAAAHSVHRVCVHLPLSFAELGGVPRVGTGRRVIAPGGVRTAESGYRGFTVQGAVVEVLAVLTLNQCRKSKSEDSWRRSEEQRISRGTVLASPPALATLPRPRQAASVTSCRSLFIRTDKQEEIVSGRKGA